PKAVVIMVSSLASKDPIAECTQAGAKHYILKPFDEEKVLKVLREVLGPASGTGQPAFNPSGAS
ncbi:MAG: response regulator, partial [Nitrospirae bacterium]|nr:response regulator [Nitrospirota bacterium]